MESGASPSLSPLRPSRIRVRAPVVSVILFLPVLAMTSFTHLVALFVTLLTFLDLQVLAAPGHHTALAMARRSIALKSSDIDTFLDAHNIVRSQHDAAPLTWSSELETKASLWADLCMMKHSDGILMTEPYGEHVVAATGDFSIRDAVGTFLQDKGAWYIPLLHLGRSLTDPPAFPFRHTWIMGPS